MDNKLSKDAYGGVHGTDYIPYVSSGKRTGGSIGILIIGIILAVLFAASTAYSGMKSGLTVAAGIPGSIIGSGLITIFAKNKSIVGKNIVQGMASGGESIASGIIFLLPAILLIGANVSFLEGFVVSAGGALFGVGVASLVYKNLIVEEHGKLMYPESLAISETLVASEGAGESMKYMGIGFLVGGIITTVTSSFLNVTNNIISYVNEKFYKWKLELEVNPLLLGIGFIVGLDVSLTMFAGSILANFAVLPLISYFSNFASSKTMSVKSSSTGNYTHCLGLGGSGSTSYRALKFSVNGACTIKVTGKSSGSSTRYLAITDASGNELGTITCTSSLATGSFSYSGGAGELYIYSKGSGINLYEVSVS